MQKNNNTKLLAALLSISFVLQQSVGLSVLATDISGVTGNNGIYDINPTDVKGNSGFRHYENFNLSKGDIANLIYKYGIKDIDTFINLVDNKININGIVNSMRDGNFYNGKAVFVSPNGMIVGASGVLNVGSLQVMTPSQSDYKKFTDNNYSTNLSTLNKGTADVTIDGKVISRGNINIVAKNATVGSTGALLAGVKNADVLSSHSNADVLFNALVNTGNAASADKLVLENGNIVIKTENRDGGINIAGLLKNNGKGNISLTNNGTQNLVVSGKIDNAQGNVLLTNRQSDIVVSGEIVNAGGKLAAINNVGDLNITSDAKISNKGELRLVNRNGKNLLVNGNVTNDGLTLVSSNSGKVVIGGKLANQNNKLTIVSNGSGLEITKDAEISNNKAIKMTNTGDDGFVMAGSIKNSGSTALTNWQGNFIIDGTIENSTGKMNLSNASSKMLITENAKISNNGDLQIINSGRYGLTIDGNVTNTATTNIQNTRNDLNINGSVVNSNGKMTISNDEKANALNIGENAFISNTGTTVVTNKGNGGLNHKGVYLGSGTTTFDNQNGSMNIDGVIAQSGKNVVLKNSGDALNINSSLKGEDSDFVGGIIAEDADVTIFNTGKGGTKFNGKILSYGEGANTISIVNKNGDLTSYDAEIINQNGDVRISNSGDGAMLMAENTLITNGGGKVIIVNGGTRGARIDAGIKNNGDINITNNAGYLETNSVIKNENGKVEIVSNGAGMTIGGNALIQNKGDVKIANTGAEGLQLKGNIENEGFTGVSNWNGDMVISGKVENKAGTTNITSAQDSNGLTITKEGLVLSNGELLIQNTGKNGIKLDGQVKNNGSSVIYSTNGNLEVNGLVQNKGDLIISSKGDKIIITQNGIVKNNGKTTLRNTGNAMEINGTVLNQDDILNIQNYSGDYIVGDDAWIVNKNGEIKVINRGNK